MTRRRLLGWMAAIAGTVALGAWPATGSPEPPPSAELPSTARTVLRWTDPDGRPRERAWS